jgi:hypothetical protein
LVGIQSIKESDTVKKTNAALKSFGDFATRKIGDLRNSNTFKSVEEKVGGAYSSVKKRVSRSDLDAPASPSNEEQFTAVNPVEMAAPSSEPSFVSAELLPEMNKADEHKSAV